MKMLNLISLEVKKMVKDTIKTGERQNIPLKIEAKCGENIVSEFNLTLSLKYSLGNIFLGNTTVKFSLVIKSSNASPEYELGYPNVEQFSHQVLLLLKILLPYQEKL